MANKTQSQIEKTSKDLHYGPQQINGGIVVVIPFTLLKSWKNNDNVGLGMSH